MPHSGGVAWSTMGRLLILLGVAFIVIGILVIGLNRLGLPLGRLPGDLSYRGRNVTVFAPIGTSILLSILLSLIVYAITHLRR